MGNYDSTDPADQSRKGWLTSILELGAWLGALLSGFMAEALSRKYGILIATGMLLLFKSLYAKSFRCLGRDIIGLKRLLTFYAQI